jgi:hypothetical protein
MIKEIEMKRILFIVAIILLISTIAACNQGSTNTQMDPGAVLRAHFAGLTNKDIDEAMVYISDDAIIDAGGECLEDEAMLGFFKSVTESEDPVSFEVSEIKDEGEKVSFYLTILVAGNPVDEGPAVAVVEQGKIKYTGICIP